MNKRALNERDICTKFITPHVLAAGWNLDAQVREEVRFTDGRIYVRGKLHARGEQKRADYILYYKPNIPIAIIEAKYNHHTYLTASPGGTEHGSPYAYDRHIQSVFMGPAIKSGAFDGDASPEEIAPTLSLLLGIDYPLHAARRRLTETIRP